MSLTRHDFRHWAQTALHGQEIIYHLEPDDRDEAVFEYARRLSHAGLAFVYQRRGFDAQGIPAFEYVARRTSPAALHALENLGSAVSAPIRLTGGVGRPQKLTPLEA